MKPDVKHTSLHHQLAERAECKLAQLVLHHLLHRFVRVHAATDLAHVGAPHGNDKGPSTAMLNGSPHTIVSLRRDQPTAKTVMEPTVIQQAHELAPALRATHRRPQTSAHAQLECPPPHSARQPGPARAYFDCPLRLLRRPDTADQNPRL